VAIAAAAVAVKARRVRVMGLPLGFDCDVQVIVSRGPGFRRPNSTRAFDVNMDEGSPGGRQVQIIQIKQIYNNVMAGLVPAMTFVKG